MRETLKYLHSCGTALRLPAMFTTTATPISCRWVTTSHLEAAAAATAALIAPTVLDDKRAGAENDPAVDGEATRAHGSSTAAHF